MPERGDSLVEAFNMWKESGEDSACCDFALAIAVPQIDDQTRWDYFIKVTVSQDNNFRGDMEQLAKELGVNCFKLFMSQKGRLMLDNAELMEAFKHIKDIGGVAKVSLHPSSTPIKFGIFCYKRPFFHKWSI